MFGLLTRSKKYKSISPSQASERLKNKSVKLIDVRTPEEHRNIRIPGSMNIPIDRLQTIQKSIPDPNTEIIVYCHSGARASSAANKLAEMGYTNVSNLGGIISWPYQTER
ncbi:MAG: hypothetical protein BGN88_08150 [Clostridiales bacterium 43-6]|nr:MAG: hypothetical protein BGN88_08150 [Clostridiales bacterium 43-6]